MAKKQRGVYRRKGYRTWSICYFDEFGKERNEVVGSHEAAVRMYHFRKNQVREGKFDPELIKGKHQMVSVAELIADYISNCEQRKKKSMKDIRQRGIWWKQHFAGRAAKSIKPQDVEKARGVLKTSKQASHNHKVGEGETLTDSTINRYVAILKSAYIYGIENGKVDRHPISKRMILAENNEIVRYLTEDEERRLFQVMPKEYHSLVTVALHTGLRASEELKLKWSDIDWQQKLIYIRDPKAGKDQTVPMRDIVIETLKGIVRMFNNDHVFAGSGTEPRKKTIENRYWKEYLRQAGIENFRWHDLRHTFGSRLAMDGVSIYDICRLMRHSSVNVTMRYAHLSPDYLRKQINRKPAENEVEPAHQLAQTFSVIA
jgi:integrase